MKGRKILGGNLQSTIIAGVVFIILFFSATAYTSFKKGQWEKDIRSELLNFMTGKKSDLEKALYSRIYYTRGVAAYVALNPEISNEEFSELAKEYIRGDSVINTLALAKDCIINAIYPLEGHEAAIGLNLLDHPERKEIVEKTIEKNLTFVAGPVELIEGGIAFISYTPIFDKTREGANMFWGVTDIVVKQNSLFKEAQLHLSELGYSFALRGYNGLGENGAVFWGNEDIFNSNPVKVNIELPIGSWELGAVPLKGWNQYPDQDKAVSIILFISIFIISILIWLFSRALIKIRNNERELKAVFTSLDSLIMEFNEQGDYLKINSNNQELLFLPENNLVGKNLSDIFDEKTAQFFKEALKECVNSKKLVVIEYPLQIEEKEHWFSARISYKSGTTAIFNAYDITEEKKKEKRLVDSEKQLKELNEMKNKFFSVIAHDIKGPLGSQNSMLELLVEQFEEIDKATLLKLIESVQDSAGHLYALLEDLLQWSLSQSGKIEMNNENLELKEIADLVCLQFQKEAQKKNIRLKNELDEKSSVCADINLTKTILRNLISNAIKFTNIGGVVRIYNEPVVSNGLKFQHIFVSDNGVGMKPEIINSLFKLDRSQSNLGTANEKGNGLGLILCKEFAEKQNSEMLVESTLGEGSTFSFKLPTV